jgi:hypothetical protein
MKGQPMTGRIWLLGILVLIGSFATTFWWTGIGAPNSPLTNLLASEVRDDDGLTDAAISAGLRPSLYLKGYTDTPIRLNDKQVKIVGWSAESNGHGGPITVIVFSDGKAVLRTQTNGPRPDAADVLKLPPAAALNIAFEGVVSCVPGRALLFIAIAGTSYFKLGARPCPA